MKNLVEMRSQAALCRQLAVREPSNRAHWLAEAERWSRREQDEIAALFEACNAIPAASEGERASLAPSINPALTPWLAPAA
jgi:hypothetical protein